LRIELRRRQSFIFDFRRHTLSILTPDTHMPAAHYERHFSRRREASLRHYAADSQLLRYATPKSERMRSQPPMPPS
jgi:hypothetical protein